VQREPKRGTKRAPTCGTLMISKISDLIMDCQEVPLRDRGQRQAVCGWLISARFSLGTRCSYGSAYERPGHDRLLSKVWPIDATTTAGPGSRQAASRLKTQKKAFLLFRDNYTPLLTPSARLSVRYRSTEIMTCSPKFLQQKLPSGLLRYDHAGGSTHCKASTQNFTPKAKGHSPSSEAPRS
jgi:hypothetical protein